MSGESKKEKVIKHPCYFCVQSLKMSGSEASDLAVLETLTPQGHRYECGKGKNDCSVVALYRKYQLHEHSTNDGITSIPLR